MAFGSGDTLLYVSNRNAGTVNEIAIKTAMAIRRSFFVNGLPQGIAISPQRTILWVANEFGWVNAIDLHSGRTATTALPAGAFGLALTPDTTQLYATMPAMGRVAVLDAGTYALVTTIITPGIPRRIAFSPDGLTAVVANEAGSVVFIR
jgi:DNA-binding beta-propeller fold protein YncE